MLHDFQKTEPWSLRDAEVFSSPKTLPAVQFDVLVILFNLYLLSQRFIRALSFFTISHGYSCANAQTPASKRPIVFILAVVEEEAE